MPSTSARLCRKLDLILPEYWTPGRKLLEHPRARELYPEYLLVSSYVTRAMVPLMEAALDRSRVLAPTDPVAAELVNYLEQHIPEEMHGHEPGGDLLDDLAAVGVDCETLRVGPLPEKMAALIGTQFFRIRHAHPAAILGFLWLEVYPPSPSFVERLIDRTRLPRDGFRLLLLHAEVDPRHGHELQEFVDSLPLEPWQERLIGLSALETMAFLINAWLDVLAGDAASLAATASGRSDT